jgi:hypothetical protein
MSRIYTHHLNTVAQKVVVTRLSRFMPQHQKQLPTGCYQRFHLGYECWYEFGCDRAAWQFRTDTRGSIPTMVDLLSIERELWALWALAGSPKLAYWVDASSISHRELVNWLHRNTESKIAILQSARSRRVSFADESDYILTKLNFL